MPAPKLPSAQADNEPGEGQKHAAEGGDKQIVSILQGYLQEAKQARMSGHGSRDEQWEKNLEAYWNVPQFKGKASWQAQETMPEVPGFVDRFAAALKEALVALPDSFYTVHDPVDRGNDMAPAIKRMTDAWLSTAGRGPQGQPYGYDAVFEEQMKLGALMNSASTVTWKEDVPRGRVAIETVDPRKVWVDPTYRNLYRIRREEMDRHKVVDLANEKDGRGQPLYNLPEIHRLQGSMVAEMEAQNEQLTGTHTQVITPREPIVLDEFLATVVATDGTVLARDALMIMANEEFLIRGPEPNPFWHGQDWVVTAPLVTVPLSVYGRSYMEDFADLSKTFTELTNLLLDAVFATSLKVFAIVPEMLVNPEQAKEGLRPGLTYHVEGGFPKDFMHAVDLGQLPPDAFRMWEALKTELREAAKLNEIGLGQFAPNSRTSATEIATTQRSSSAVIRSIAQTVEARVLNPHLDLTWKTGLQHVQRSDRALRDAAGERMFEALLTQRRELIRRPVTFQARGLSQLIQNQETLNTLIQLTQIVGSNEALLQQFFQEVNISKFLKLLFSLSNIDITKIQAGERERLIQSAAEPLAAAADRTGQGSRVREGAQNAG